jgi:hypothetical protein
MVPQTKEAATKRGRINLIWSPRKNKSEAKTENSKKKKLRSVMDTQSTNQVIMVAPTHFCFNEETSVDNVYMQQHQKYTKEGLLKDVMTEFSNLVESLQKIGS